MSFSKFIPEKNTLYNIVIYVGYLSPIISNIYICKLSIAKIVMLFSKIIVGSASNILEYLLNHTYKIYTFYVCVRIKHTYKIFIQSFLI